MWDNPRGQLPGLASVVMEKIYTEEISMEVQLSGTSPGGVAVTGESLSGGRSLPECFREWLWRSLFW